MAHIVLESKGKTSLLVKYPEKYLLVMAGKQSTELFAWTGLKVN